MRRVRWPRLGVGRVVEGPCVRLDATVKSRPMGQVAVRAEQEETHFFSGKVNQEMEVEGRVAVERLHDSGAEIKVSLETYCMVMYRHIFFSGKEHQEMEVEGGVSVERLHGSSVVIKV